ncbi:MAG: DUF3846 domain-containing protein [Cystobacter sp.]
MTRILKLALGKSAEVVETDTELADLQRLVGGYIEAVYLEMGLVLFIDEEGVLKNKPQSWPAPGPVARAFIDGFIRGDAFVMAEDEDGEPCNLTDDQVLRWGCWFCDCRRGRPCNLRHEPSLCDCEQCDGEWVQ